MKDSENRVYSEFLAFRAVKEIDESVDSKKFTELRNRHTCMEIVDAYVRWNRIKPESGSYRRETVKQ